MVVVKFLQVAPVEVGLRVAVEDVHVGVPALEAVRVADEVVDGVYSAVLEVHQHLPRSLVQCHLVQRTDDLEADVAHEILVLAEGSPQLALEYLFGSGPFGYAVADVSEGGVGRRVNGAEAAHEYGVLQGGCVFRGYSS